MNRHGDLGRIILYGTIAVLCALLPGGSALSKEARLLSSGPATITFEVEVPPPRIAPAGDGMVRVLIPGFGSFSPPGAVEVPGKTFRVAVPAAGEIRVTYRVLAEDDIGEIRLARMPGERFIESDGEIPVTELYVPADDPWEGRGLPPVVGSGEATFMGRQRVLPVLVNPLRSVGPGVSVARTISITVHIDGGGSLPDAGGAPAPPSTGAWDRLYKDLLVNPSDTERFRKPFEARRAVAAPYDAGGKRLKILVPETGLYAIRADSLIESGLSTGVAIGLLSLKKLYHDEAEPDLVREVDIPILIIEGGTLPQGMFEGDDLLLFYALGVKDDTEAGDLDAGFTDDNVFWLEEGVAGVFMEEIPAPPPHSTTNERSYRGGHRERKDTYFLESSIPGSADFYFLRGPQSGEMSIPFQVHYPDTNAGQFFSLTLRVQGYNRDDPPRSLSVSLENAKGRWHLGSRGMTSKDAYVFTFDDRSAEWLTHGENRLLLSSDLDGSFVVNDFSIDYPSFYEAHDDMIEFKAGIYLGSKRFEIEEFTVDSGVMLDITDPHHPRYQRLSAADFTAAGGGRYTLGIDIEAGSIQTFLICGEGGWGHIGNGKIVLDGTSGLMGEAGPFHTLIISHAEFLPPNTNELNVYADWRRQQGFRILVADVEDVFDECNGGMPHQEAIRRFIRYGFDHWGVEYVLLVGDGNVDHKQIHRYTPTDFIPPYSYCMRVEGQGYRDEVIALDNWFAFIDEEGFSARQRTGAPAQGEHPVLNQWYGFPDVFIGRFPVGSELELRAMMTKIRNYENTSIEDSWRRNVILFSDDAWSGLKSNYRYRSSELYFERSLENTAGYIDEALPGGFDIEKAYMKEWTDNIHPNNQEQGPDVYKKAHDYVRANYTPYLIARLNEGCLFWSFQGHANRSTLATEAAFASHRMFDDLSRLQTGNYSIFLGFGCHISEFAVQKELQLGTWDGPNGDCFTEQLLFRPGAGAVSTYASTAYEFLTPNSAFCERIHDLIFRRPPTDSIPPLDRHTGAYWFLREMLTMAEIERIGDGNIEQVFRYIMFGDPMLKLTPGPSLMTLTADFGQGWEQVAPDSLRGRHGSNSCMLRLTASDVVALGAVSLDIDGVDYTDSLTVIPIKDLDKDFARAYQADLDYTIDLGDERLLFTVFKPDSEEAGVLEVPIETTIRLFHDGDLEITPGMEAPQSGEFRVTVDFPVYLSQKPILLLDWLELEGVGFARDAVDSLHWEAEFNVKLDSGTRIITVRTGEFSKNFVFSVTGDELVVNIFNFPNPFSDGTNIVFTFNLSVDAGMIRIYNVSGILVRSLRLYGALLGSSNFQAPGTVYWDGRDSAGDRVANGTYLYMINVARGGSNHTVTGKAVKLE